MLPHILWSFSFVPSTSYLTPLDHALRLRLWALGYCYSPCRSSHSRVLSHRKLAKAFSWAEMRHLHLSAVVVVVLVYALGCYWSYCTVVASKAFSWAELQKDAAAEVAVILVTCYYWRHFCELYIDTLFVSVTFHNCFYTQAHCDSNHLLETRLDSVICSVNLLHLCMMIFFVYPTDNLITFYCWVMHDLRLLVNDSFLLLWSQFLLLWSGIEIPSLAQLMWMS